MLRTSNQLTTDRTYVRNLNGLLLVSKAKKRSGAAEAAPLQSLLLKHHTLEAPTTSQNHYA
jgi:hypothetical protein